MIRSLSLIALVGFFAFAGLGPAFAASPDTSAGPAIDDLSTPVEAPFNLAIRNRTWDGNTHAMPAGRAMLEVDGQAIWELADVTRAAASADGSTVALLTGDYQVFVARLPETPRRIDGGPYLIPALSSDGTFLVAQRLGERGHILEKTFNTRGIALINLDTGEDRLLLEGNDLHSPSFGTDDRLFFGSSGKEGIASLYMLDLASMSVARVTNRESGALQTFPSEAPRVMGGTVVYRADGELFQVAEPAASDFVPVRRFDAAPFADAEAISPDFGTVLIRRPSTQSNNPKVYFYYDVDKSVGRFKDWNCSVLTYDQHEGTDFNQGYGYDVVAPASGRVIKRNDGCADTNSPGCGLGWGNFVIIQHTDGSVSLEAHGKNGTVALRGSSFACGATLMQSASSGNSGTYHIHHESWVDSTAINDHSKRYDPYQGSCDANDPSKWSTQNGYKALPGTTCTN